MAIGYTTLFTRLGKLFGVQEAINTARGTTLPPLAKGFLDEFNSASLLFKDAIAPTNAALESFQAGGNGAQTALSSIAAEVITETVEADNPQDQRDVTVALKELIKQMTADSESVDAPTVSATITADSGNNGDGVLVVSVKRPDGLTQENAFAEDIRVIVTGDETPETASLSFAGELAEGDKLSHNWPQGSGSSGSLTATDAADSLLDNGDFDDEDDVANAPDDWIVSVGTIGTTIKMTDYEVQRIAITNTPSAGTYHVNVTTNGKVQTTIPLAYNATGTTLQDALRLLEGLEDVTVSTSGTTPNFTHDITYTGVAGNLTELTVTNRTTSGTFTVSTPTTGSANAYKGKAVEFDSDGSQLTTINQNVALEPLSQYAVNLWMLADVVPAAGVITVDLVDGIGGTVINDAQGTANSFTIDCTALSTSFVAKNGVFRTPRALPTLTYVRVRISTGVSSGTSIFFDHMALVEMQELYVGGPSLAVFSGKTPFHAGSEQVLPDGWTIAVSNNYAGEFQQWFERNFDMTAKGLLLPSNSAGSETQADTLIA